MARRSMAAVPAFKPDMKRFDHRNLEAIRLTCLYAEGLEKGHRAGRFGGIWIGILDASGQAAYTDERYWIKMVYDSTAAGTVHSQITLTAFAAGPRMLQTTATNLAELDDNTHLLPAGTYVWGFWCPAANGVIHRFFSQSPGATAIGFCKITSTGPLKGDWKAFGTAAYDDNGAAHYSVTDEGTGITKVDDVFPGILWPDGTIHIASIYHRLKDV